MSVFCFTAVGSIGSLSQIILPQYFHASTGRQQPVHPYGQMLVRAGNAYPERDVYKRQEETRQRIHQRFQAKAVEMEGAAVAHACYMHGVPCGVIRSISDQANGASTMDYPSFVRLAAANSEQVVRCV